jgi:hypothetical protein
MGSRGLLRFRNGGIGAALKIAVGIGFLLDLGRVDDGCGWSTFLLLIRNPVTALI